MSRGVVGARGGAVLLSPQATGAATLSASRRYLVYEVGRSVRVDTGIVGSSSLRVHDFATGEDAFVVPGGHDPTFRSDGTIVYLQRIIQAGSNAVRYQPMERRGLLGAAVRLGPLLQPVGELVPASGDRALVELETSVSQSYVVILQAGAAPTRVTLDATQAGVVATSDDGRRALVWALRGHTYALAIVRAADGRVLSQADTGVPESQTGYLPSPTGVWSGSRAVVAFNNQLVVANIDGGAVRIDERVDIPDVSTRQSGGHPIAVEPQWVRFLDSTGGSVVLAADLEPPNLGGGVDINLFTCRLRSARCTRTQVGRATGPTGGGMALQRGCLQLPRRADLPRGRRNARAHRRGAQAQRTTAACLRRLPDRMDRVCSRSLRHAPRGLDLGTGRRSRRALAARRPRCPARLGGHGRQGLPHRGRRSLAARGTIEAAAPAALPRQGARVRGDEVGLVAHDQRCRRPLDARQQRGQSLLRGLPDLLRRRARGGTERDRQHPRRRPQLGHRLHAADAAPPRVAHLPRLRHGRDVRARLVR